MWSSSKIVHVHRHKMVRLICRAFAITIISAKKWAAQPLMNVRMVLVFVAFVSILFSIECVLCKSMMIDAIFD